MPLSQLTPPPLSWPGTVHHLARYLITRYRLPLTPTALPSTTLPGTLTALPAEVERVQVDMYFVDKDFM